MPEREQLSTAVICTDKPGAEAAAARQDLLAVHLEYIETILDRILLAGPLYDDGGEEVIGSLLVFNTGDASEARALLEDDPYFKADFWETIRIHPFLAAAGSAVGGKTW